MVKKSDESSKELTQEQLRKVISIYDKVIEDKKDIIFNESKFIEFILEKISKNYIALEKSKCAFKKDLSESTLIGLYSVVCASILDTNSAIVAGVLCLYVCVLEMLIKLTNFELPLSYKHELDFWQSLLAERNGEGLSLTDIYELEHEREGYVKKLEIK